MDLPFFFQAEDGIRDTSVTGVQTCALPIFRIYREKVPALQFAARPKRNLQLFEGQSPGANNGTGKLSFPTREQTIRSEERRVGKECRYRGWRDQLTENTGDEVIVHNRSRTG